MEKKVVIYSTPTCTYCLMLKDYLNEKAVQFEEYDVAADTEKREEMMAVTGGQMGVPVTTIDGEVVVGFDKDKLEELLAS